MKNPYKLFGIIALIAVIGFSFSACDDGSTGGGGGGGGGGTFTITDIPSNLEGKYAHCYGFGGGVVLEGGNDPKEIYDPVIGGYLEQPTVGIRVQNGKVSIPMWIDEGGRLVRYSGNTANVFMQVDFYSTSNVTGGPHGSGWIGMVQFGNNAYSTSITFSGGSATKSWNENYNHSFL
jgi:hypothetical protein